MDDSLEALLEKATNPRNTYEDWEFIMAFCDRVNTEANGPVTALQMIVPKIKDKNDKVALLALTLLEACVKNCGKPFHQELGKFKFLNEMIRIISPKYLAKEISEPVQTKVKALLYSWKLGLPHEPKIAEAYEMLKKQGLVFDESVPLDPTLTTPTTAKPKVTLQEDPRQAEMLGKLVKSKNPEDLRAANRLIREMVRRDEKRMEKLKKRLDDLELINNNIKLLNEMLCHYKPSTAADHEKQIIEELYGSVEKMRPQLFRMASELQQNEEGMSDIIQANDALIRVLDFYERVVGPRGEGQGSKSTPTPTTNTTTTTTSEQSNQNGMSSGGASDLLLDLADLNFGSAPPTTTSASTSSTNDFSLPELPPIGINSTLPPLNLFDTSFGTTPATTQSSSLTTAPPTSTTSTNTLGDFDLLSGLDFGASPQPSTTPAFNASPMSSNMSSNVPLMSSNVPLMSSNIPSMAPSMATNAPLLATSVSPMAFNVPPVSSGVSPNIPLPLLGTNVPSNLPSLSPPATSTAPTSDANPLAVLDNLNVPLTNLKPSSASPVQLVNKNGITVSIYFTDYVAAPDVSAMVISILSTSTVPLSNFQLQAAVPKVMRIKLLPPTSTELPAFNPLLPPSNIHQVMLLANPSKAKIRLKYRISFLQNNQEVVETGDAPEFPSI